MRQVEEERSRCACRSRGGRQPSAVRREMREEAARHAPYAYALTRGSLDRGIRLRAD
jgi:hypothetical protein